MGPPPFRFKASRRSRQGNRLNRNMGCRSAWARGSFGQGRFFATDAHGYAQIFMWATLPPFHLAAGFRNRPRNCCEYPRKSVLRTLRTTATREEFAIRVRWIGDFLDGSRPGIPVPFPRRPRHSKRKRKFTRISRDARKWCSGTAERLDVSQSQCGRNLRSSLLIRVHLRFLFLLPEQPRVDAVPPG
jgi:hypothetical protein